MKKKFTITSNLEQKSILKKSIQSSEKENVDLYKAIFGGAINSGSLGINNPKPNNCDVVAISGASAAYNKVDQFLRA